MASQHIEINGSATRHNAQLRSLIDSLQQVKDDAERLKAVFDQTASGSDWTSLGTFLGISAADAETAYNLLGSVNNTLQTDAFIGQMLSRMG